MARCSHQNVTIIEYLHAVNVHFRYEHEWTAYHDVEGPTGELRVECRDCGFQRNYLAGTRRPKWIEEAINGHSNQKGELE